MGRLGAEPRRGSRRAPRAITGGGVGCGAAGATRSAARSRTRARAPRRAAPPERCGVSLPARPLPDGRGLSARPPRPPHAEQF
ncbi:MAG: hypothetical protein DWI05_01470 [Planctomycetota bacterium]|nr:MAG: hypothetical protein DWI05_01470 [Planctomycetota bacterium]